jgi:hypothetical protein
MLLTQKMPNTTTGFLPLRSAAIPQTVEVKHLPNIKEAPESIQNMKLLNHKISTIY